MKICSKCKIEKNESEFHSKHNQCKECFKESRKKYDKKYSKQYYLNNKRTEYHKQYKKRRLETDTTYKLIHTLRGRITTAIRTQHGKKAFKSIELLGCSIQDVRSYLESQFKEGMTWENHGDWHIDHIKPCVSFDLTNPEEQKKCFHYTNLQPLWAEDNLSKYNKN